MIPQEKSETGFKKIYARSEIVIGILAARLAKSSGTDGSSGITETVKNNEYSAYQSLMEIKKSPGASIKIESQIAEDNLEITIDDENGFEQAQQAIQELKIDADIEVNNKKISISKEKLTAINIIDKPIIKERVAAQELRQKYNKSSKADLARFKDSSFYYDFPGKGRESAQALLSGQEVGTFLLRQNDLYAKLSDAVKIITISLVNAKKIDHVVFIPGEAPLFCQESIEETIKTHTSLQDPKGLENIEKLGKAAVTYSYDVTKAQPKGITTDEYVALLQASTSSEALESPTMLKK